MHFVTGVPRMVYQHHWTKARHGVAVVESGRPMEVILVRKYNSDVVYVRIAVQNVREGGTPGFVCF